MTDEEFGDCVSALPGPPFLEDFEAAALGLYRAGTPDQKTRLLLILRSIPASQRLTSEQRISRALRSVLERTIEGAEFLGTPELRLILAGLEYFIPSVLGKVYPYWEKESLDGFHLSKAKKTDTNRAELEGVCILISDQTVTSFHADVKISPSEDKIERMDCRLGKKGGGKGEMNRVPWSQWRRNPLVVLKQFDEPIDSVYKITFPNSEPTI